MEVLILDLNKAIKLLEQEYEHGKQLSFVRNPLAWSLYRVWKKADGQKDWEDDPKIAHWKEWWPSIIQVLSGEKMLYQCSACTAKYSNVEGFRYCPHCGAFMDEIEVSM